MKLHGSNTMDNNQIGLSDQAWDEYLDVINNNNVFDCAKDSSVLELAANGGWHSRLIYNQMPSKLVCVEPDPFYKEPLQDSFLSKYDNTEYFCGTYNDFLETNNEQFDVVVCCGLLYHLHSPLDCLEKILNIHKPSTLIIETVEALLVGLSYEHTGEHGNAFNDKNKITLPYNLIIPAQNFKDILLGSGYACSKDIDFNEQGITHKSKKMMRMMAFTKYD